MQKFTNLYDGAHEKTDHYDSLVYPLAALEDTFILIVDDWNWSHVREGTLDSISDNKLNIVSDIRHYKMEQRLLYGSYSKII